MVNIDRHIAIQAGWIAGPAFGVAMMAAPEYLHLGPILSGVLFWGGILVFLATIVVVFVLSVHEENKRKAVLGPIIMMAISALIFCGGAAWYFWPREEQKVLAAPVSQPTNALDRVTGFACSWSQPPSHYREDKTLHIVDFQGVPVSGINPSQQTAGPMHFVRSSEPFSPSEHYSSIWYRCDVTNHSTQPIRNLWAKFPVVYNAAIIVENGIRSGEVIAAGFARSPIFDLAAGETDCFYFANASTAFITVLPPQSVLVQTMADDTVHEVRVITSSGWNVALMPSPKPLHANPPGIEQR